MDRLRDLFGGPPLRHQFLFGRGMVGDDTEHTCMDGQALLDAPEDVDAFARSLAWRLRFWLLRLPAGTGRATLRAVLKLWLGFSPRHSGVWSAGNGPALRAALLGVCLGHDPDWLRAYVRASTRLTHAWATLRPAARRRWSWSARACKLAGSRVSSGPVSTLVPTLTTTVWAWASLPGGRGRAWLGDWVVEVPGSAASKLTG
jgi:hypothetical protein